MHKDEDEHRVLVATVAKHLKRGADEDDAVHKNNAAKITGMAGPTIGVGRHAVGVAGGAAVGVKRHA